MSPRSELIEPSRVVRSIAEPSLCRALAEEAKLASRQLAVARGEPRTPGCAARPRRCVDRREEILAANARDVAAAPGRRPRRGGDRSPDAESRADRRDGPEPAATSPRSPTRSARSSPRAGGPTGWKSARSAFRSA